MNLLRLILFFILFYIIYRTVKYLVKIYRLINLQQRREGENKAVNKAKRDVIDAEFTEIEPDNKNNKIE